MAAIHGLCLEYGNTTHMMLLLTALLLTMICIVIAALGKAVRQLILTLSLFLIAAANHKGQPQKSLLQETAPDDFAVSDQLG